LLAGQQNARIAEDLGIEETAVKEHIKSILQKAKARSNEADDPAP
jgi:DNA-binding NarL/FixJ family response regulator